MSGKTQRPPMVRIGLERRSRGLVIDNFAGGGGASTGIAAAIGRPCDVAINHDPKAIRMHMANHPETKHFCESVWDVDPREVCGGQPIDVVWFSPDCTHFSNARGDVPKAKAIRGLAWVVVRYARLPMPMKPRVMFLENVPEFRHWGPLGDDGRPIKSRRGETYNEWLGFVKRAGYRVEMQMLTAADYGAPTTRKRVFIVMRRDDEAISWPEPTHGENGAEPWRAAAEIINWEHPTTSIFERRQPLVKASQYRIAEGIRRFVIEDKQPFVIRHGHYSKRTGAGLVQGKGAGLFRGQPLTAPLATICGTNDKHLVVPIIRNDYGTLKHKSKMVFGHRPDRPLGTISARDSHGLTEAMLSAEGGEEDHSGDVHAFLMKYYGQGGQFQSLKVPLHTITSKARFAVVEVHGKPYRISDIRTRMLQPDELYAAQGFPADYQYTHDAEGKKFTKELQIHMVGNSVAPPVAEALVREGISS